MARLFLAALAGSLSPRITHDPALRLGLGKSGQTAGMWRAAAVWGIWAFPLKHCCCVREHKLPFNYTPRRPGGERPPKSPVRDELGQELIGSCKLREKLIGCYKLNACRLDLMSCSAG